MSDANAQQNDSPNEITREERRVRHRQERARVTQARFRDRRNQERRELLEANRKMKAAIADIVRTADFDDRPRLIAAVRAAADLAGVNASDIAREEYATHADASDATPTHTTPPSATTITAATTTTTTTPAETSHGDSSSAAQTSGDRPNPPSDGLPRYYPCSSSASATFRPSGRLSPRLDYGIWVDAGRASRSSRPPREIIPFIGAGRYTFAGQLYWACGDYLISLCRLVTTPYAPSRWFSDQVAAYRRLSPQQAEDRIWSVLRHSPPVQNVRLAQALAEAHREFRDMGYISGDSPACDDEIGILMRREVEADYVARGHDLRSWMTIDELVMHVRLQLGNFAFSRLERAIAPPSQQAVEDGLEPDSEARNMSRLLIKNLAESYICFGDGPRWRTDSISTLFSQKINI
ncbi:hypothetical protein F5Y14DRAFT_45079 [Nemania sp. NC0429]|nr:hypothetical protein F5Y14DRAFT_45079 [Nemania sp. NC0429]